MLAHYVSKETETITSKKMDLMDNAEQILKGNQLL
jgi:hypothetical protein